MHSEELFPGAVVWAALNPVKGREQRGHRPVLVVSSPGYLEVVDTLVTIVPITSVDRAWPNHIRVEGESGLGRPSWVMTEQIRTLSRDRLTGVSGRVSSECLSEVRTWLADFLDF